MQVLLLQHGLYTRRSEQQLMAQLVYNLLFRRFAGLAIDDTVWHPTAFTKSGGRFLASVVTRAFLAAVLIQSRIEALLSDEQFSADSTLIEARAALMGLGARDDHGRSTGRRDWAHAIPGQRRRNATQASTTAPEARRHLMGNVLMQNRHGLELDARSTRASGTAEREAPHALVDDREKFPRMTVGAGKTNGHGRVRLSALGSLNVTVHVVTSRRSAIDRCILRHPGSYRTSDRFLRALVLNRSGGAQPPCQSSGISSCSRWSNELNARA